MRIISTLLFCFVLTAAFSQKGYKVWLNNQLNETHLQGKLKTKKVYKSTTGNEDDLKLVQEQTFEQGWLVSDKLINLNGEPEFLFNIKLSKIDAMTVEALNLNDSTLATYSFTEENKLRYYVVNNNPTLHLIYTYDSLGNLLKCKDCMNPLGKHEWCVYYGYTYNKNGNLTAVYNYRLLNNQKVDEKELIASDTLFYNSKNQLTKKVTKMADGQEIAITEYSYNKKGLLIKEYSTQTDLYPEPRSYMKTFQYRCNRKRKTAQEKYFKVRLPDGSLNIKYDRKGRKVWSETLNKDGERTTLYVIKYSA